MMEYYYSMNFETLWEKFKNWSYRMAALFAELGIGVPGIVIAFENNFDNRYWVLGFTSLFLVLSFIYSNLRNNHSKNLITPYLVVQTGLTTALLVLNPNLTFYVLWFYVLTIEAVMAMERRYSMRWLITFIVLTVVILAILLPPAEALVSVPVFLGGFFFFVTFANATQQANDARKESLRLLAKLKRTNRQLQDYAINAERLAVAEERNRLSREMHDTIGHRLTVSSVQLEGLQKLIYKEPTRAESMAVTVREQVREALQELRQAVATLRQPLEADIPLEVSIKRLVLNFEEATELRIHLILPDHFPELTNNQRLAIYRTSQEALTNAHKHAEATQIWLQIDTTDDLVILRVSDNGNGLEQEGDKSGFGLRGIQERAALLGGEMKLEPRTGGGTQLSLWLPIKKPILETAE
jgi:signal transduction histidine kinase